MIRIALANQFLVSLLDGVGQMLRSVTARRRDLDRLAVLSAAACIAQDAEVDSPSAQESHTAAMGWPAP